jgi:putative ATP-binding cassette transporter
MNARRAAEITSDFQSASLRSYEDKASTFAAIAKDNVFAQSSMFLLIACVVFLLPQASASVMPELPMIATVLLFMFGPIATLMTSEATFSAANAAAKSLAETEQLLEADGSLRERSVNEVNAFQGVVLQDVVYRRPDKAGSEGFRVGPVSLEVRPGEMVFITGGNGSGKSTLLNVLVGLYPRDTGEILIGGRPLTNAEIWRWQAQVSAVFYNFHLFEKPYGAARALHGRRPGPDR